MRILSSSNYDDGDDNDDGDGDDGGGGDDNINGDNNGAVDELILLKVICKD